MAKDNKADHRISLSDMMDDLERVAIDPKKSMDNKLGTSLFGGGSVSAGRWYYPPNLVAWPPMPDPGSLASEVVSRVVSDVTSFAASYLGEKIGDLLSPPSIGDIVGLAGQQMSSYLVGPKELASNIFNTQESQDELKEMLDISSGVAKIKDKVEKGVGDVKEKVFGFVDQAGEWVGTIQDFITQGPQWVEAQANNIDSRAVNEIAKQIDIRFKKLDDEKKKFVESMANKLAQKKAAALNEKIYEAAFNPLKRVEQLKAKAMNLATSVAKDALLNMKAMLGL